MRDKEKLHVLSYILLFAAFLFIIFSNDNPVILVSIYVYIIGIFVTLKKTSYIKASLYIFTLPAIVIIILNVMFVNQGSIVLFTILGKRLTLESLIYAVIMALKFLAVIYIFLSCEFMIDSDGAISYFSSIMPKTTLTLMLMFKLIPMLKNRFFSIKDVYTIRGVSFKKDNGKANIKSYIHVMSVLLESSLENSFDISEAAYVRGFLSTKRTIYDRRKFTNKDIIMLIFIGALLLVYTVSKYKNYLDFQIYNGLKLDSIINPGVITIFILIAFIAIYIIVSCKEGNHEVSGG